MQNQPIRTSVEMEERIRLPLVWVIVLSMVGAGIITHIVLWLWLGSGLVIWPFIFAVSVLLIVNAAADENAAGIPPFQVYALFFATLIALFLFVMLVSVTINPWLLVLGAIACGVYLMRDWKQRKTKDRERERRRLAGLCVRCCQKVESGLEDVCPNCGQPVNPERLDLFRLARAISMRSNTQPANARQVLSGAKPSRSQTHMQNLMNKGPYRYNRGK